MQEYTRATGAASSLENAERDAANQFVSDALASTTNLISGMNRSTPDPEPDASKAREFAEYELQNQLAQPIPIVDAEYDANMEQRRSAPVGTIDLSGIEPVSVDPEELVDEDLDRYGVNTLSPTYQGLGTDSVYSPLSPLSQQVFGGMQGYNRFAFEDGGTYIGERGGMTGGDFDHDTNKKAIIDEESGKKEGELTGGEAVFNEDHLADVVQMIKEGDEDGLFAYLKNLLQEPQFGYDFA